MDIYFVRHGETDGNLARRHQQEDTTLTELGRKQASEVATVIKELDPTHLFVSQRMRALETGQIISKQTGLDIETSDLFTELCRPQRLYGNHHRSFKSIFYLILWFCGYSGDNECGKKGESYRAFRNRITKAKEFLVIQPADARIIIVSHSVFINLFLVHMNRKRALLPWQAALTLIKIIKMKNASLTHVQYITNEKPNWRIVRD